MTQTQTVETLSDERRLKIVVEYINGLLQQQQQLESDKQIIRDLTERLRKLSDLRQVLKRNKDSSLDAKYGMNPETKLGRRIIYVIDNVNKLSNNSEALEDIRQWLVVSVLFGVYEYFSKNKTSLPDGIVKRDFVNLEYKVGALQKALAEKDYLNNMDFMQVYRDGDDWNDLKELLPDSIYTSIKLRQMYNYRGYYYYDKKEKRFEYFDNWLYFVFSSLSFIEDREFQEIQRFIESMIEVFIEYCPRIAIEAYLTYSTHVIRKTLDELKQSNGKTEKELSVAIPEVAGLLPQELIEKVRQKSK